MFRCVALSKAAPTDVTVEIDGVPPQRLLDHRVELVGVVMLALVAEEKHTDGAVAGGESGG